MLMISRPCFQLLQDPGLVSLAELAQLARHPLDKPFEYMLIASSFLADALRCLGVKTLTSSIRPAQSSSVYGGGVLARSCDQAVERPSQATGVHRMCAGISSNPSRRATKIRWYPLTTS